MGTSDLHSAVSDSGKPSYTEVAVQVHFFRAPLETNEAGGEDLEERYSLVSLKLHTGRTHQIRVHMLAMGHPLICDRKYTSNRYLADRTWCPRNFLHTYPLGFLDVPCDRG